MVGHVGGQRENRKVMLRFSWRRVGLVYDIWDTVHVLSSIMEDLFKRNTSYFRQSACHTVSFVKGQPDLIELIRSIDGARTQTFGGSSLGCSK